MIGCRVVIPGSHYNHINLFAQCWRSALFRLSKTCAVFSTRLDKLRSWLATEIPIKRCSDLHISPELLDNKQMNIPLSSTQIKTLEKQLLALQQEVERTLQLDEPGAAILELDQTAIGRLTRMDAMQGQAIVQATQEQHRLQLQRIAAALQAIKEGDYGHCEDCGKAIPFERLSVNPEAHCCIGCQEKLEAGA
jgi:DnaK suppressor protein